MTPKFDRTRRVFLGAMAAGAAGFWPPMAGWNSSMARASRLAPQREPEFLDRCRRPQLTAQAHLALFYTRAGERGQYSATSSWKWRSAPGRTASGVYFHTAYQESGSPVKGFEIQVNNVDPGEGAFRDR